MPRPTPPGTICAHCGRLRAFIYIAGKPECQACARDRRFKKAYGLPADLQPTAMRRKPRTITLKAGSA
jgi:hypothetical protein